MGRQQGVSASGLAGWTDSGGCHRTQGGEPGLVTGSVLHRECVRQAQQSWLWGPLGRVAEQLGLGQAPGLPGQWLGPVAVTHRALSGWPEELCLAANTNIAHGAPAGAAAQNGAQSTLCSQGRPEPAGQEEMRGAPASSPRPPGRPHRQGPVDARAGPRRGPGGAGSREGQTAHPSPSPASFGAWEPMPNPRPWPTAPPAPTVWETGEGTA